MNHDNPLTDDTGTDARHSTNPPPGRMMEAVKRRPFHRLFRVAPSVAGLALATAGLLPSLSAQEATAEEAPALSAAQFDQQSLALRTALFHDPALEAPLKSLAALYEKAGRAEELIGLYSQHLAQYPDDAGARAVLVRLLQEWNRPEAISAAQAAVEAHPEHALANYLRYRGLEAQRDPRALDFLLRAVELETEPHRKQAWTEQLLAVAVADQRRELVEPPLRALIAAPSQSAASLAALAQRLNRDRFFALALEALAAAGRQRPAPEMSVEIELQAAAAEAGLGRKAAAGERLEKLLGRVAPDYARRAEIVSRRVAMMESNAEREAKLKAARAAWAAAPASEAAALDLAEWLIACELRTEALRVLREAGEALPQSTRLEAATLDLLDRLADERGVAEYLQKRLAAQPRRDDLAWRLVRALYAVGAREEAAAAFESLLGGMDEAARPARRLDLARALVRLGLPEEAAKEFENVLAADPKRLEVRRELAEARLAAGDRAGADALMREALAPDAEIENFLDVIGFMMSREQWPEAREALQARWEAQPKQFEVAMLLLDVLTKLGEQAAGETLREQLRPLADTDARFRRWLEGARALAEAGGVEREFFAAEQQRLVEEAKTAADGWSPTRAARYLTVCELAKSGPAEPELLAALRARLEEPGVPAELRVALRRLLVEALRTDPKQTVEVQNHLQLLVEEDTAHADEYRLRLAQAAQAALTARGGDPETMRALLGKIDVARINDAALLRGASKLFLDHSFSDQAFATLERLTALEPQDLGHWEKWLGALAGFADEERLRDALRRVLGGVTQTDLSPATLELLRGHLVDSCWRSLAAVIAGAADAPDRLAEALPLLEVIERTKKLEAEQLWVTWTRGWVLRRTGRADAAEEAATRLEELAARWPTETGEPPRLTFPDGLSMSLEQALLSLRDPAPFTAPPAETPQGPDRAPIMRWGFQTENGAAVVQVIAPAAGDAVFVLDETGTLYRIDAATGKLRWRLDSLWIPRAGPAPRVRGRMGARLTGAAYHEGNRPVTVPPRLAWTAQGDRLFFSHEGKITALAGTDGSVVWENTLEGASQRAAALPGQPVPPPLADEVFLDQDGRLLVWRAETARAAALHPDTGKLLWSRDVSRTPPPAVGPLTAGAACEGNTLLVYGQVPAVLDTATGAVRWTFDAAAVREFPVVLRTDRDEDGTAATQRNARYDGSNRQVSTTTTYAPAPRVTPPNALGAAASRRVAMNYLRPLAERSTSLSHWMTNQGLGVLVAPAVAWAEQEGQALGGALAGGRLLLSLPWLTLAPSLSLPMDGPRFQMQGTFLGATSQRAVFLNENQLIILDLARQTMTTVPARDALPAFSSPETPSSSGAVAAAMPLEGAVVGPRVFVTGPGGLLCVNPLSVRVLYATPWPAAARRFAGLDTPPRATAPGLPPPAPPGYQYQPRALLRSTATASTAVFPRGAARGNQFYAVLNDHSVIALGPPASSDE